MNDATLYRLPNEMRAVRIRMFGTFLLIKTFISSRIMANCFTARVMTSIPMCNQQENTPPNKLRMPYKYIRN